MTSLGAILEDSWVHKCSSENPNDCNVCATYIKLSSGDCKVSVRKKDYGQRYIFLHAFSRDALLVGKDTFGNLLNRLSHNQCMNLDKVIPTSEFVMECKSDHQTDYHKQMNGDLYDKWFTNRLIPSFEQLYPDKKAIFFIDQAPFHINRVAFPRSDCNKKEIAKHYEHHNISNITVIRKDGDMQNEIITFTSNSFVKNKNNKNALQ